MFFSFSPPLLPPPKARSLLLPALIRSSLLFLSLALVSLFPLCLHIHYAPTCSRGALARCLSAGLGSQSGPLLPCLAPGLLEGRGGRKRLASHSLVHARNTGTGPGKTAPQSLEGPLCHLFSAAARTAEVNSLLNYVLFGLILKLVHILLSHINRWLDAKRRAKAAWDLKTFHQ